MSQSKTFVGRDFLWDGTLCQTSVLPSDFLCERIRMISKSRWMLVASLCLVSCADVDKKQDSYTRFKVAASSGKGCGKALNDLPRQEGLTWSDSSRGQVEAAFSLCLSEYSQLDTHASSLEFLKSVFKKMDIPLKESSDKETSRVIAYMSPGPKTAESILMVHPTDLVNGQMVSREGRSDYMWGQQQNDIKSIGMMQLMAMAFAKKRTKPFRKNLVFVATENGQFKDALQMFPKAEIILNEGGMGFTKQNKEIFLIGSEQKGGAWLKIKHKSPARLLSHLDQLMAVFIPHDPQDFKEPGKCQLTSFTTYDQKVNAIPHKVDLELQCKGINELLVGQAFAHQDVTFFGKRNEGTYFISLEMNNPDAAAKLGKLSALQVAAQGLQKLSVIPYRDWSFEEPQFYKHVRTPASVDFVKTVKDVYPSASPWGNLLWELDSAGEWSQVKNELSPEKRDGPEKLFRTACSWTGFEVHSGSAEAYVDCRLIHTGFVKGNTQTQADLFVKQLKDKARDAQLNFEVIKGWDYVASDPKSGFVDIMKQEIHKEFPKASTGTWLSPVSLTLESPDKRKIPSYGFYPVLRGDFLDTDRASSFPTQQVFSANRIYSGTVSRLAN